MAAGRAAEWMAVSARPGWLCGRVYSTVFFHGWAVYFSIWPLIFVFQHCTQPARCNFAIGMLRAAAAPRWRDTAGQSGALRRWAPGRQAAGRIGRCGCGRCRTATAG